MDIIETLKKLNGVAKTIHGAVQPLIDHISTVSLDSHSNLDVIRRSILRRQHDSLSAAFLLVDINKGESSLPYLRPACEELIWLRYFNKIGNEHATALADLLLLSDMLRTLNAQCAYTPGQMEELGLSEWHDAMNKLWSKEKHKLRGLGNVLGWPKPKSGEVRFPSVKHIAGNVGYLPLYNYLYFATSKAVHFNAHELTRRIWGAPPKFCMGAPFFRDYWSLFSMIWGSRLLLLAFIENYELVKQGPDVDESYLHTAIKTLKDYKDIPIIVGREFHLPQEPYFPHRSKFMDSSAEDDIPPPPRAPGTK